jgi:hypothetical protein
MKRVRLSEARLAARRANGHVRAARASSPAKSRPRSPNQAAQALVEFALVIPILMTVLLGVAGTGIYLLAAQTQAAAAVTDARWAADHPASAQADFDAYASRVGPCPGAVASFEPNLVRVTITCPTIAGDLIPFLPKTVVTTATAYVP